MLAAAAMHESHSTGALQPSVRSSWWSQLYDNRQQKQLFKAMVDASANLLQLLASHCTARSQTNAGGSTSSTSMRSTHTATQADAVSTKGPRRTLVTSSTTRQQFVATASQHVDSLMWVVIALLEFLADAAALLREGSEAQQQLLSEQLRRAGEARRCLLLVALCTHVCVT